MLGFCLVPVLPGKHIFTDGKLAAIHIVDQLPQIAEKEAVILDFKHHTVRIKHGIHIQPRRKKIKAAFGGGNAAVKGDADFVLLGDEGLAVILYNGLWL